MDVIKNCLITHSDAKVLREFCIDKANPLYRQYKGYNTSVNLEATNVYNMYAGVVSNICGDIRNGYEVGVLINQNQAIKYGHLKSIDVKLHQSVDISTQIGVANKYVSVEYMTTYTYNQYSYRIGSIQMYKDDPAKILDSATSVISNTSPQYSQSGLIDVIDEYDGGMNLPNNFIIYNIPVKD